MGPAADDARPGGGGAAAAPTAAAAGGEAVRELVAGCIAGAANVASGYAFDTIKVGSLTRRAGWGRGGRRQGGPTIDRRHTTLHHS